MGVQDGMIPLPTNSKKTEILNGCAHLFARVITYIQLLTFLKSGYPTNE